MHTEVAIDPRRKTTAAQFRWQRGSFGKSPSRRAGARNFLFGRKILPRSSASRFRIRTKHITETRVCARAFTYDALCLPLCTYRVLHVRKIFLCEYVPLVRVNPRERIAQPSLPRCAVAMIYRLQKHVPAVFVILGVPRRSPESAGCNASPEDRTARRRNRQPRAPRPPCRASLSRLPILSSQLLRAAGELSAPAPVRRLARLFRE